MLNGLLWLLDDLALPNSARLSDTRTARPLRAKACSKLAACLAPNSFKKGRALELTFQLSTSPSATTCVLPVFSLLSVLR